MKKIPVKPGEVEHPDARAQHVGADGEQVEAHQRLVPAAVAALVPDPEHEQHGGDAEQRRPQRAVPAALLDEGHQDADDGRAEQHDAERVESVRPEPRGPGAGR